MLSNKRYKIVYITDTGNIGGAEKVLISLLRNLDKDVFQPFIILGSDGPLVKYIQELGLVYKIIKMPEMKRPKIYLGFISVYNPLSIMVNIFQWGIVAVRLFLFLRKNDCDLVHTNTLQSKLCGSFAAKLARKKLIWHIHNIQPPGLRREIVARMANIFPDKIITVSEAVKATYVQKIKDPQKITVIYNGIQIESFEAGNDKNTVRKEFNIPQNVSLVVSISVLRPGKGLEVFLKVAAAVRKKYPDVKFLIVGEVIFKRDRGYKEHLLYLSRKLEVSEAVVFTGFRQDIPNILSQVDVFVFSSILPDSFPTVLLEAMAMGKPVVASRVGGVSEIVVDKITGFLVPPDNPEETAKYILLLLREKNRRKEMGIRGRDRVRRHFSLQGFMKDIEILYTKVLEV